MTKQVSLVYKNIHMYRFIMNILYGYKYKRRFENILPLIDDKDMSLVELCFGDIYIAEYAVKNGKKWFGIDINDGFVNLAKKKGFNAIKKDVFECEIPRSDVCIISGSLYHFVDEIENLLEKMLNSSNKIIISEPIKTLSNNKYIGFVAKKLANAGNGNEKFRFTEDTLVKTLDQYKESLSFSYEIVNKDRDLILVIKKC